jgi:hypothetical protein
LAKIYKAQGLGVCVVNADPIKNEIKQKIVESTGLDDSTVRYYLTDEFKQELKGGRGQVPVPAFEKVSLKVGSAQARNQIIDKIVEVTGLDETTVRDYISSEFKQKQPEQFEEQKPRVPVFEKVEKALGKKGAEKYRKQVLEEAKLTPQDNRNIMTHHDSTSGTTTFLGILVISRLSESSRFLFRLCAFSSLGSADSASPLRLEQRQHGDNFVPMSHSKALFSFQTCKTQYN